ncbi:MAG: hypothetical protein J7M14_01630, partial [Planctomycetes bacterium]|nr:hypothetical protein [Planctomycetota bacterium]
VAAGFMAEAETSAVGAAVIARALTERQTPLAELASAMKPAATVVTPGAEQAQYARLLERYINSLPRGES